MNIETIQTLLLLLVAVLAVILLFIFRSGYNRAKRVNKKASSPEVKERYKKIYNIK